MLVIYSNFGTALFQGEPVMCITKKELQLTFPAKRNTACAGAGATTVPLLMADVKDSLSDMQDSNSFPLFI